MLGIIAFLTFLFIEIVLLPTTLLGLVWYVIKLLRTTRRDGTSISAYIALLNRYLLNETGKRSDEASKRLAYMLPATSPFVVWLTLGPTLLAARVSGYMPGFLTYPTPQCPSTLLSMMTHSTKFFDSTMFQYLDRAKQIVFLGAGWDTRGFGLVKHENIKVFEIDTAPMQKVKRAVFRRLRIPSEHITFVSADLSRVSWIEELLPHGFDVTAPTLVMVEGSMFVLQPETVATILGTMSSRLPDGSAIAFDYPAKELLQGKSPFWSRAKLIRAACALAKEPWLFGISTRYSARKQLEEYLHAQGLQLAKYEPYGREDSQSQAFGGLVVAIHAAKGDQQAEEK